MKMPSFISAITLFVLLSTCLQAGVIPGRWEKVDALQPGKEIIVTLKAGDRIESTFTGLGSEELILTELKVPRSEVRKIVRREKYDDGILIGL